MNPVTHLLLGWAVAGATPLERRERAVVTLASVAPDIDGFGMIAQKWTENWEKPLMWWKDYHHVLGHNLTLCLLYCFIGLIFVKANRLKVFLLAFLSFHLHLLCDVLGGKGPMGDHWPIQYLYPFTDSIQLEWGGQWELNAWPNFVITGVALTIMFYWAWKRGQSPLEIVSLRADKAFVDTLRNRFPIQLEKTESDEV